MNDLPWWERHPGRLQREVDALDRAGIAHERDEEMFAAGILRLRLQLDVNGERIPLVVTFPESYPFFRFQVKAPTLSLTHHQNPLSKDLCLIGRGTHHWHTDDTVAGLLQAQLPTVVHTGEAADKEAARGLEQEQAEPFSDYYPCSPSIVIIPSARGVPVEHECGTFAIATAGTQGPPPQEFVRGAVAELRSRDGELLIEGNSILLSAYSGARLHGHWIRVPEPIRHGKHDDFLNELLNRYPFARSVPANRVDGGWLQIWGVLFPEEVEWRTDGGDGWIFVCLFARQRSRLVATAGKRRNRKRK